MTYLANEQDPDGNHRLPYVAPKIEELTGVSASEWMAKPDTWVRLIHPDDRERVLRGEPKDGANRRALRDRVPVPASRRVDRVGAGHRPLGRTRRSVAGMAGRDRGHHGQARSRGASARGRDTLPPSGRADPGGRLHRRGRRDRHRGLHQPAVRGAHRVHPRGAPGRARAVGADAPPRRPRDRDGRVGPNERIGRRVRPGVPDHHQGRPNGVGARPRLARRRSTRAGTRGRAC